MSSPIGIIFDMDGVVVDNHHYHLKAWQAFCKKYGLPLTEDDYRDNINGRTAPAIMAYLFGDNLNSQQVLDYTDEKESLYRELYAPHLQPTPGLSKFLSDASDHHIPMAVATSAPTENVEFTLDGLDIRSFFKIVIDQHRVTHGKPHPEVYTKACQALELPPEQCVVFEDAISGIKAGNAAGCHVVGVATSHKPHELTPVKMTINDFRDITIDQTINLVHG